MTSAKETARARKESAAKTRAMFDREITHLRVGDWRGMDGAEVQNIAHTRDLHGTVCTDCPGSVNYKENVA